MRPPRPDSTKGHSHVANPDLKRLTLAQAQALATANGFTLLKSHPYMIVDAKLDPGAIVIGFQYSADGTTATVMVANTIPGVGTHVFNQPAASGGS